jgi:hypothetical protein
MKLQTVLLVAARVKLCLPAEWGWKEGEEEDLNRYCHTWEGIGHALQAGGQATGCFLNVPTKQ